MIHTVANWRVFLDEIDRVLSPQGVYLQAQWITPPARMDFEGHFRRILAKYEASPESNRVDAALTEIKVEHYLRDRGYRSTYWVAKAWTVSNTVEELLGFFNARAYGLCWRVAEDTFRQVMEEFEAFCLSHYGSLQTELSSEAKFELWAYRHLAKDSD
jgi:hypothetical protein